MQRRSDTWTLIVAAAACLAIPVAVRAQAVPEAPAAAKTDAVDAAIARAGELSQRASALAEAAAKQRADLEALRSRLADENRRLAAALAARTKELEDARGQLSASEKEVTSLRATVAERTAALAQQSDAKQRLDAKDGEIATLRGEVQKLQGTIAREHDERDKALAAAKRLGDDKQALETELKRAASANSPVVAKQDSASAQPAEAAAQVAPEGAVKKWQKPDGSLFFGERPPPGSKLLGYTTGGGL